MSVPWKKGASPEDAVFPLRADRAEIKQYLVEMKVLKIEVLDDSNQRYGKAQFQLDKLFDEGSNASAPVNVVLPILPSKGGGTSCRCRRRLPARPGRSPAPSGPRRCTTPRHHPNERGRATQPQPLHQLEACSLNVRAA